MEADRLVGLFFCMTAQSLGHQYRTDFPASYWRKCVDGVATFDIGSRRTSAPGLAVFAAQIHGLRGASDDALLTLW